MKWPHRLIRQPEDDRIIGDIPDRDIPGCGAADHEFFLIRTAFDS